MKISSLIPIALLSFIIALCSACFTSSDKASNAETEKRVLISTNYGDMKVILYNETPMHRDNFIKLATEGFYDNLLFHRVIPDFMIQGGDPESRNSEPGQVLGLGGPGYTIKAELGKGIHKKGALSAARLPDNANPEKESSGSQFFIVKGQMFEEEIFRFFEQKQGLKYTDEQIAAYMNLGGRPDLDNEYTVFGEVYEGLEVLDKILTLPTDQYGRPYQNVIMQIRLINE
jgi:cyclophilin family peptidyl-prolyl cis-trans isomerase